MREVNVVPVDLPGEANLLLIRSDQPPAPSEGFQGVRCPACGRELVARMTKAGPGYPCLCRPK